MPPYGVTLLRIALGIVLVWFGALVIGRSPVGHLVAGTVYWADPRWFVPFLGLWEMAGREKAHTDRMEKRLTGSHRPPSGGHGKLAVAERRWK